MGANPMRAWQVLRHAEPSDALQQVEVARPEPGAGQVRIAVRAAAVGLPDVFMCRGTYPLTPPGVFVPGQEVAGVVSATGPGTSVAIGTRVMAITDFVHGHGGFADETLADADNVYAIPAGIDDAEAAGFLIAYLTAWIGLVTRAALHPDETVLVLGATGGTGSAAVQLAHALGATVIGVVNGDAKVQSCRELGADHVIDRSQERIAEAVCRVTDGRGAHIVYDPVGGTLAGDAMRAVASEGRFLLVGFASGAWPEIDAARVVMGNFAVMGVYVGATTRPEREAMLEQLFELVASGALRLQVDTRPFHDLPAALTDVAAARARGRIVVLRD
ncbi:MAG TPA: NADPH:quinone oxidoreductase family protein [Acidimicrobiia bacterium]|jgi:NADPH2:quinone reductase